MVNFILNHVAHVEECFLFSHVISGQMLSQLKIIFRKIDEGKFDVALPMNF